MNNIKITLPLPPSVNQYLGYKIVKFRGKAVPQPYEKKISKDYKNLATKIIHKAIQEQGWITPDKGKYVLINLTFYMDRKRKDQDNMGKVLFDSIVKSGLILDDDIIITRTNDIYIDKFNPRIELMIEPSRKIGIFKNLGTLNEFMINNCSNCSRLKRNCSILNKSTDNYITKEVDKDLLICSSRKPLSN